VVGRQRSFIDVNNAFIRKSTTNYTLDSVKGSPYTLSSDGRTVEDHASIELLQRDRESLEESFDSNMAGWNGHLKGRLKLLPYECGYYTFN
jgi:hypothetical protein